MPDFTDLTLSYQADLAMDALSVAWDSFDRKTKALNRRYDSQFTYQGVIEQYGLPQEVKQLIDKDFEDLLGGPERVTSDTSELVALENIKAALRTIWDWILKTVRRIKNILVNWSDQLYLILARYQSRFNSISVRLTKTRHYAHEELSNPTHLIPTYKEWVSHTNLVQLRVEMMNRILGINFADPVSKSVDMSETVLAFATSDKEETSPTYLNKKRELYTWHTLQVAGWMPNNLYQSKQQVAISLQNLKQRIPKVVKHLQRQIDLLFTAAVKAKNQNDLVLAKQHKENIATLQVVLAYVRAISTSCLFGIREWLRCARLVLACQTKTA